MGAGESERRERRNTTGLRPARVASLPSCSRRRAPLVVRVNSEYSCIHSTLQTGRCALRSCSSQGHMWTTTRTPGRRQPRDGRPRSSGARPGTAPRPSSRVLRPRRLRRSAHGTCVEVSVPSSKYCKDSAAGTGTPLRFGLCFLLHVLDGALSALESPLYSAVHCTSYSCTSS